MKKMSVVVFILLIFLSSIPIVISDCGCNCQTWENSYGKLEVCPMIVYKPIPYNLTQYWNFTSYVTASIDIAFRFNFSLSKGGLYYWVDNETGYIKVNVEYVEYNGFHYYIYQNFNVVENNNYSGYWIYDVPMYSSDKWELLVKLHTDPMGTWRIILDPWWNVNYGSRVDLWVDASQVDSDLTNFPVRVYINGSSHMYYFTQSDLDDIVFVNTANTSELDYELENYTKTGNKLYANYWVEIPSVSSSVNTHFNMYYNCTGAGSMENPTGVWDSNYMAVWHMHNTLDSTNNDIDLTNSGVSFTTGKIGNCGDFEYSDGTGDYMYENGIFLDTPPTSNELMFECVVKHESDTGELYQHYISKNNIDNQDRLGLRRLTSSLYLDWWMETSNSGNKFATGSYAMINNIWYYVCSIYDNNANLQTLINDSIIKTGDSITTLQSGSASNFFVGGFYAYYGDPDPYRYTMDGMIDELRVSKVNRSRAWIKATYRTIFNDDTFIIWGDTIDYYYPPTLSVSNIFPENNSYWCNYIVNLTNLSITVNCPYGTGFCINITFLENVYSWYHVYNGTYNVSLIDKIPYGTTNYSWIVNISSDFCVEMGGSCYYNASLYFDVCWGALTYMNINNLYDVIYESTSGITETQFFIFIMFVAWLIVTLLNYIDINNPEIKRNKLLGLVHVLFSAPLIFYFAYSSYLDGLLYGYAFTLGFIVIMVYIVGVQSMGE